MESKSKSHSLPEIPWLFAIKDYLKIHNIFLYEYVQSVCQFPLQYTATDLFNASILDSDVLMQHESLLPLCNRLTDQSTSLEDIQGLVTIVVCKNLSTSRRCCSSAFLSLHAASLFYHCPPPGPTDKSNDERVSLFRCAISEAKLIGSPLSPQ